MPIKLNIDLKVSRVSVRFQRVNNLLSYVMYLEMESTGKHLQEAFSIFNPLFAIFTNFFKREIPKRKITH